MSNIKNTLVNNKRSLTLTPAPTAPTKKRSRTVSVAPGVTPKRAQPSVASLLSKDWKSLQGGHYFFTLLETLKKDKVLKEEVKVTIKLTALRKMASSLDVLLASGKDKEVNIFNSIIEQFYMKLILDTSILKTYALIVTKHPKLALNLFSFLDNYLLETSDEDYECVVNAINDYILVPMYNSLHTHGLTLVNAELAHYLACFLLKTTDSEVIVENYYRIAKFIYENSDKCKVRLSDVKDALQKLVEYSKGSDPIMTIDEGLRERIIALSAEITSKMVGESIKYEVSDKSSCRDIA